MFYELHTRSAFSFLSSGSQPQRLAQRAAELEMPGAALIDRDTVAGAVRFHFEAKKHGIKPIVGAEITMDDGSFLPLVPMNLAGYQNLSKLITTVKLRHKKGKHFATRKDIEDHSSGLLCFTGGADGFMHKSIKAGRAQIDLAWLNYVFEKRLYVELQRHHLRSEEAINQSLLGLAHKLRLPYFASNGTYYADQHDRELFDVFTCIKNHCSIYDAGKLLSKNNERYLKSQSQMLDLFEDIPSAVHITEEIADRVKFSMDALSYNFPDYDVPPGETVDSLLRHRAISGAIERYRNKEQNIKDQVQDRLDREFKVISMKGLAGYFLMVADISQFCVDNEILSQGRGSAANSVVCYALGITAVEPIKNKLLFERFLSESYEQYPDIDIDLPSGDDREQVIQHVYREYGERGAGMTANVISYRGKSAVREVGKTFGFGPDVLDRLSKLNSHYETFKGEELDRRLKEQGFDTTENIRLKKFAELYNKILDFPRHLGQHSGGMVVSLNRLDGIVPLEPASMPGRNIIQWDKDDCDALKIVKVDLLGLGMMAVLRDSITLISQHHDKTLNLYKIPTDDPKVYEALQTGDTVGMFQVESRAQIAFLPKSKPANFYDIVVQVAIIRPGPIVGKMLHSYLKRRQGLEKVDYIDERLRPTLERTMGVPLFQEQLLKIAMDIAGFTSDQTEDLRKAMGFKRPGKKLETISENLRKGMEKTGVPKEVQENIVNCVLAFSNYGFPESHAFSFALLAYASAYFMVHYRACFMAAMFNNYPLGFYNAATLVKDAQRHGLHFIALDINRSKYEFTVEEVSGEKQVRVGLNFVRGLRKDIGEMIVAERDRAGFYISIADLIDRVPEINKREIRALSLTGALNFDGTIHRREALWQSELLIQPEGDLFSGSRVSSPHVSKGSSALNRALTHVRATDTNTFLKRLEGLELVETDLRKTGISIGKHPMAFVREEMKKSGILSARESIDLKKGQVVSVAGAVIIRQRPMTANNVVFITLEDETGHSNFVVMPDVFEKYRAVINQNDYLIIRGIYEERGMLKSIHFEPIHSFNAEVVSHNFR
ncbi:MAG: error-prone DNA polymerase [Chloracidobacterium sp.]|nr:error-prone DNA polymerase [Chloracidobacterium sp.]